MTQAARIGSLNAHATPKATMKKSLIYSYARLIHTGIPVAGTLSPALTFRATLGVGKVQAIDASVNVRHSSNLANILQSEIEHEQGNVEELEQEQGDVYELLENAGWTVNMKEGFPIISLTKDYNDEKICVQFNVEEKAERDDELDEEELGSEEDEDEEGQYFGVAIDKPSGSRLGFRCVAEDGVVLIENMFHFTAETMSTKGSGQMLGGKFNLEGLGDPSAQDTVFEGPVFEDLDEQLQKELVEYLEERGVYSEDFANYVQECAELKEQHEYLVWLSGIKDFVTE